MGAGDEVEARATERSPATRPADVAAPNGAHLGGSTTLPTVLSGLLAWAVTVAPAGFARGSSLAAAALATLACAAAVAGPAVGARRPTTGRHVGVTAFLGLSVATWLASSTAIHPLRLDPIRGVFGAIAWAVFVLAWSERWSATMPLPADGDAPQLKPRATLPSLAAPIGALGLLASLVFLWFAWTVADPERALVSHAVAVGCAVAVVSAAAQVATGRGRRRSSSGRKFTAPAIRSLALLVIVAIVGAVILVVR
ncbi:MAG TPA: hypothetical protein VGM56_10330 [Byssovorax sp.]|jgi:hypothetical protein